MKVKIRSICRIWFGLLKYLAPNDKSAVSSATCVDVHPLCLSSDVGALRALDNDEPFPCWMLVTPASKCLSSIISEETQSQFFVDGNMLIIPSNKMRASANVQASDWRWLVTLSRSWNFVLNSLIFSFSRLLGSKSSRESISSSPKMSSALCNDLTTCDVVYFSFRRSCFH